MRRENRASYRAGRFVRRVSKGAAGKMFHEMVQNVRFMRAAALGIALDDELCS
jgi:hypothetical protein